MTEEYKNEEKIISLKEFVDDHQKVIAVIGVLTALAIFWTNLPLKEAGAFAAFWCILSTIPLYLELWLGLKNKKATWQLLVFLNLLAPVMYNTIRYAFVAFRPQWKTYMPQLIFFLFAASAWRIYRKLVLRDKIRRFFFKFSDSKDIKNEHRAIDIFVGAFIVLFSILLSDYPSDYFNRRLDATYKTMATPPPTPNSTPPPTLQGTPTPNPTPTPT